MGGKSTGAREDLKCPWPDSNRRQTDWENDLKNEILQAKSEFPSFVVFEILRRPR
jgi:hypothetical protein